MAEWIQRAFRNYLGGKKETQNNIASLDTKLGNVLQGNKKHNVLGFLTHWTKIYKSEL